MCFYKVHHPCKCQAIQDVEGDDLCSITLQTLGHSDF